MLKELERIPHLLPHYQTAMLRLKDRNMQIPGGMRFYLPELKWKSPGNYPSFNRIVQELTAVIHANPFLAQKHGWPTDSVGISNWVDLYNATVCAKMGWNDYLMEDTGGTLPKSSAPHQTALLQSLAAAAARAKDLVSGAKTLTEWIDSKDPAVDRDKAEARALTCSTCPRNEGGDLTAWFTVPAAELIKRQIERAQDRNLSTIHDQKLHLCTACHCPLKLKVHVPIEWIVKRLTPEQTEKLKSVPNCWIIAESK